MPKTRNDNQDTPTEPPPNDQVQDTNRDPDQEPELQQSGKILPNTTTNPRIKNL